MVRTRRVAGNRNVDGGGPKAEEAGGNPKAAAGAWVDGHDIRNKAGKSVDVGGEEVLAV
jgi:hypothetical protein